MRIGLIADIHGNAVNLQHALEALQRHDVTDILCAGDLVDGADHPDEVIDLLQARRIPCVQGNHDSDKLADIASTKNDSDLSAASLRYLETLPFSQTFTFADKTLLLIHATPWHNGIHVFSYSSRPFLNSILHQSGAADIIVIGHTHEPMAIHYRNRWILNPGSVHQDRFEDRSTCAILDLPSFSFDILEVHSGQSIRKPVIDLD